MFGFREDPAGGWNFIFDLYMVSGTMMSVSTEQYDYINGGCKPYEYTYDMGEWMFEFGQCWGPDENWPGRIDCSDLEKIHSDNMEHFVLHDTRDTYTDGVNLVTTTWDIEFVKVP